MAMQAAVRQCDIKGRKILPLLQEYFSKIKYVQKPMVHDRLTFFKII